MPMRLHERARSLTGEYALTSMPQGDPEQFEALVATLLREFNIHKDDARDHLAEAIVWNESRFYDVANSCERKGLTMDKTRAEDAEDGHYWLLDGYGDWEVVWLVQTENGPEVSVIGRSRAVKVAIGTMLYGPIPKPTDAERAKGADDVQ